MSSEEHSKNSFLALLVGGYPPSQEDGAVSEEDKKMTYSRHLPSHEGGTVSEEVKTMAFTNSGSQVPDGQEAPSSKSPQKGYQHINVGILGGGITALFTALCLARDNIPFTIFEAHDLLGGRLFTHYFDEQKAPPQKAATQEAQPESSDATPPDEPTPQGAQHHPSEEATATHPEENILDSTSTNYLDIGAMRFPQTALMGPLWKLFSEIGLELKPYYYVDLQMNGKLYYNQKHHSASTGVTISQLDPSLKPHESSVPQLSNWIKTQITEESHPLGDFVLQRKNLHKFELQTHREFLRNSPLCGFESPVIDAMETLESASGRYHVSSSWECLAQNLAFATKTGHEWGCIPRGTCAFVAKMLQAIRAELNKPENDFAKKKSCILRNAKVFKVGTSTQIPLDGPDQNSPDQNSADDVIKWPYFPSSKNLEVFYRRTKNQEEASLVFTHVISAIPVPALAAMDFNDLNLSFPQRQAMRTVKNDHSVKIGATFTQRFWENPKVMDPIFGGKSLTDMPIRCVVYPSYGFADENPLDLANGTLSEDQRLRPRAATDIDGQYIFVNGQTGDQTKKQTADGNDILKYDNEGKATFKGQQVKLSYDQEGPLMLSYCWTQDAEYLAAQFRNGKLKKNSQFEKDLLAQIAQIHGLKVEDITPLCKEIYCWDWHQNPETVGPFGMFSVDQFDELRNLMKTGIANNRFQFASETVSLHHGWVIGSIKSSLQALLRIFSEQVPVVKNGILHKPNIQALKKAWHFKMCLIDKNECVDCNHQLLSDKAVIVADAMTLQQGKAYQILEEDKDLFLPFDDDEYKKFFKQRQWVQTQGSFRFRLKETEAGKTKAEARKTKAEARKTEAEKKEAEKKASDANSFREVMLFNKL